MAKTLEEQDGGHPLGDFQESQFRGMPVNGFNQIDILVLESGHVIP